ncbi:hypothetical protein MANES_13G109500v8 [Manihot esculenta]|uniref:Uncharacterized protein n=1 Tax=Manihot esculenta TaxID=3983 RepID=A0A2C9UQU0_MANES|nr:hypothetical protein MANES_13G109500v8 [Manihot esculenta]
MGTAFISGSCVNWCQSKESQLVEPKGLSQTSQSCVVPALRKLDSVASWLLNGVAAVFFSSLERCSCVYIDTKDDSDYSNHHLPLILNDGFKCEQIDD